MSFPKVRSRDPTRKMTLRYDKLYMGHDVFFFNDRTGKVERLHANLDTSGSATVLGSLIDGQVRGGHKRHKTRKKEERGRSQFLRVLPKRD